MGETCKWEAFRNKKELDKFIYPNIMGEGIALLDLVKIIEYYIDINMGPSEKPHLTLKLNKDKILASLKLYPVFDMKKPGEKGERFNRRESSLILNVSGIGNSLQNRIKEMFPNVVKREVHNRVNLGELVKDKILKLNKDSKSVYILNPNMRYENRIKGLDEVIKQLSNHLGSYDKTSLSKLLNRQAGIYTIVLDVNPLELGEDERLFPHISFGVLGDSFKMHGDIIKEAYLSLGFVMVIRPENLNVRYPTDEDFKKYIKKEDLFLNIKTNPEITSIGLMKNFLETLRKEYFKHVKSESGVELNEEIEKEIIKHPVRREFYLLKYHLL